MKKFYRDYFAFSAGERKGVYVLLIVLLFVILAPSILDLFYHNEVSDFSKAEENFIQLNSIKSKVIPGKTKSSEKLRLKEFDPNKISKTELGKIGFNAIIINNWLAYRSKGGKFYKKQDLSKIYGMDNDLFKKVEPYINIFEEEEKEEQILKNFDPNTADHDELKMLGFNEFSIKNIEKYRSSGGYFKKDSDILKIYGINTEFFAKIRTFICIDTTKINSMSGKNLENINTSHLTNDSLELNSADSLQLLNIFRNKYLVSRILKYKNLLGGFYSVNQLKEVYGFKDTILLKSCIVDTQLLKKININTFTFKQINKHPYISYDETKAIFAYKKIMGKFQNPNDLILNNLMNSDTYKKIEPYLICN